MRAYEQMRLLGLFFAVVCPFVRSSEAAPFSYSEAVSGDLPTGDTLPLFTLDIGINTVSGTFGTDGIDPDFDSFAFKVPRHSELTAGQVALTDVMGNVISGEWQLRARSAKYIEGALIEFINADSPGIDSLDSVPQRSSIYNISHVSFLSSLPAARANYIFTFELAPVIPEPASAVMMLIGGGGMLRRRRQSDSTRQP